MALMGPDGETHSHLMPERERGAAPGAELPDRGAWVGPRGGRHHLGPTEHGLPLDPPQSTLPPMGTLPSSPDASAPILASVRHIARENIRILLDHQPMVSAQRRALMQALIVLESFR